jgi:hypothetical protein
MLDLGSATLILGSCKGTTGVGVRMVVVHEIEPSSPMMMWQVMSWRTLTKRRRRDTSRERGNWRYSHVESS